MQPRKLSDHSVHARSPNERGAEPQGRNTAKISPTEEPEFTQIDSGLRREAPSACKRSIRPNRHRDVRPRDQHDLPLAPPGAALPRDEIGALGLAPDEAGEPRRMRRIEPALARQDAERRERLDRPGETFHGVPAQLPQAELVADEAPGRRRSPPPGS